MIDEEKKKDLETLEFEVNLAYDNILHGRCPLILKDSSCYTSKQLCQYAPNETCPYWREYVRGKS
jgi:hypothetical protein